jgi:hypothetical protein
MKAGYGRGYYGQEQLAKPPTPRGSRWTKWALAVGVVGAGAVIWLMWPRKPEQDDGEGAGPEDDPRARALPLGQIAPAQRAQPVPQLAAPCFFPGTEVRGPSHSTQAHELSHGAEARGYRHGGGEALGSSHGGEGRGSSHGGEGRGPFHGSEARGSAYGGEGRGPFHGSEARGSAYGGEGRGAFHGSEARGSAYGGEGRGLFHSTMSQSQQAYEDAVVASARQLQATGNKVVLAPHLAHLASRIAS